MVNTINSGLRVEGPCTYSGRINDVRKSLVVGSCGKAPMENWPSSTELWESWLWCASDFFLAIRRTNEN